jgi:hypothetical protein
MDSIDNSWSTFVDEERIFIVNIELMAEFFVDSDGEIMFGIGGVSVDHFSKFWSRNQKLQLVLQAVEVWNLLRRNYPSGYEFWCRPEDKDGKGKSRVKLYKRLGFKYDSRNKVYVYINNNN